ncbi:MAG: baeRF10 domain-containing protein [Candidatus Angelobacter sp.]
MITREEIRQLAQCESPAGCAISFYFQPQTPQNKSHREEAILVKDLVRDAMRKAERNGNQAALREDLEKVLKIAEGLQGNHSRGKAIFACREQGIWRELDIPPRPGQSQITVNSRFHLRPLVHAYAGLPRTCIALVNRKRARIFELHEGEITQKSDLEFGASPHVPRSDGFQGYEAGHRERHVENMVMQHYKMFAESLLMLYNLEKFDALLVGCIDEAWPEIEPQLQSSSLKQRLRGRVLVDPMVATAEEVREQAGRILSETQQSEQRKLVRETIGEAQRNARGAVGLRHVLNALERQEVQTLLLMRDFKAEAVECINCRHMDTRMVKSCAVCGQGTRELSDVSDTLVDLALRNGAEIRLIDGDADLEKAGRIAALLRFRADQNTAEKMAV